MARLREGSKEAFLELVRRWEGGLEKFFLLQGTSPEEAEDSIQETFLRVFKFRDRYRNRNHSFRAFLFRVARNVLVDQARVRQRLKRLQSISEERAPEAWLEDPTSDRGDLLDARAALVELPPRQRVVVILSIYEGLEHREIAEVLEIPVGTVKSRMFHALKTLRGRLSCGIET